LPELRKDPIVGRWVIISTDRAKRPTDFLREGVKNKGGFCPFCYGNENKTPPEIQAYRPNPNGGPPQTLRLEGKMGDVLYDASSPYQMVGQERFTNFLYGKPPGAGGDIVGESPALEV